MLKKNNSKLYSLLVLCGIIWLPVSAQKFYFGDIHVHSNLSFDTYISVDSVYSYARDRSKLDFICISDHDYRSTEAKWGMAKQKVQQYYIPGRFVTLLGYEYTRMPRGGHQIVIYPGTNHRRFSMDSTSESLLNSRVRLEQGIINIAHPDDSLYTANTNNYSDVHSLIELSGYQFRRFEYFGNPGATPGQVVGHSAIDLLNRGYHYGFYGSSDSHDGKPGLYGLTGIYTDTLTREAVFNALKEGRTFATNGKRIKLRFTSNGFESGDQVQLEGTLLRFDFRVEGTSRISRIDLIHQGQIYKSYFPNTQNSSNFFEVEVPEGKSYYYLRVSQTDGGIAWSSPIFVSKSSEPSAIRVPTLSARQFKIFPNPTSGFVNIIFEDKNITGVLELYNILGEIVSSYPLDCSGSCSISLDADAIPSGIYTTVIKTDTDIYTTKLIIYR